MAKTNNEKDPMGNKDSVRCISIEFETVPPQKGKTEAQKPKKILKLLQEGEEYIVIKAEDTKSKDKESEIAE